MTNNDYDKRELIIFDEHYDEKQYLGGCRRFEYMTVETLQRLVSEGFAEPNDKQNAAPSLGQLIEYGKQHSGVTFSGYTISIRRDDYRVSIDAVNHIFANETDAVDFSKEFHTGDEFIIDNGFGYAWWD